jgi:hypothetical protein
MSVSCECCVLSGSGLCSGLNTHPEESYPVVVVMVVVVVVVVFVCVCVCVCERERDRERLSVIRCNNNTLHLL